MKKIYLLLGALHLSAFVFGQNLDDITQRNIVQSKPVLTFADMNESDISWEKKIWRVIDVREKLNQSFLNPSTPFFDILTEAARQGEITLYSTEADDFSIPLSSL